MACPQRFLVHLVWEVTGKQTNCDKSRMEESKKVAQRKTTETKESCLPGEDTSAESDMSEQVKTQKIIRAEKSG